MQGDERIEGLIDAALRSYAEPGEIPEARVAAARVLERAAGEQEARRRGWAWGWVAAAACAVMAIAVLGAMWEMRAPRKPEIAWAPKAPEVAEAGPEIQTSPGTASALSREAARLTSCAATETCGPDGRSGGARGEGRRQIAQETLPKQEVFPTPRPLSAEEQALVTFAKQAPPGAKKAVIDDQQHWDDPIIVAAAQNSPVVSGSQQDQ